MTSALELIGVTKTYAGNPETTALRDLTLRVDPGELVAVVGPSGSGKSTLLQIAGTLERPTTGAVHIAGSDTRRLSDTALAGFRARHLGFVFQQFFLLPHRDVLANIAHALLYRSMTARSRRAAAAEACERVGLGDRRHHLPGQLSGGECQRVAIARALVGSPTLILADEPTGNLDSATGGQILGLLRELNSAGTTLIVITHDREVAAAAQRQVELRDGVLRRDSAQGVRHVSHS
ncbi:ABC transporter ATP-binding protein [Kribbella sp. NPDC000426]|uniref:ABC transporter ATP-binding protein n=1 Tax=Kribbella sp. NPDC000426 TaxID=3154255 RepID=UPI0033172D93